MSVSLQQIAQECGLATATVRNILASQAGAYSAATRERVMKAADRHGYYPSRLPQLLRKKKTPVVGMLVGNTADPYPAELLDAFTRTLSRQGLDIMVGVPHWSSPQGAREALRSFLGWGLRAFLINITAGDFFDSADIEQALKSTVIITMNGNPWPECSAVYPDRETMAELAINHLVELGHRRIGMLAYAAKPEHPKAVAIQKKLNTHGLALMPNDFLHAQPPGEANEEGEKRALNLYELGRKFAYTADRPTALIAWSESLASLFLSGFLHEGGKVPRDLSIVTYNQTRCACMVPLPLTAVGVHIDTLVTQTIELMNETMAAREQGRRQARQIRLEPKLLVRKSTAPPGNATI